ncbi:glycosyltransferase family 2 protein [Larkinella humicola]|uniref:Glycosyltransferase family 2 protein n=1 Tax=Larkinella humicola TaxID=2607654 RepID=A0A5N1JTH5_9BACT|nr:glycosyltransferase family 2 protein [Larkinella humicola]KAA9357652.1 glycosyltransferase family 2 protein [Larkinella humicola]
MENHFPGVTLLVTHYNRSGSLERLLKAFQDLNCSFDGVVVSDDGSKPEHVNALTELTKRYDFQLVTTPKNRGLGNNINKGQDAVKTPYTLYVQEDFVPKAAFATHFRDALDIMNQEKDLDLVRFYAYFAYPYLEPYGKGFSRMVYKPGPWYANHLKFYLYSDHPHLRRSNFLQKFGRYVEGKDVNVTEFQMCLSVIQKKGKGLFFNEFTTVFDQKNSASEPSTFYRASWRESTNPFLLFARWWYLKYRLLKNTFELALLKE